MISVTWKMLKDTVLSFIEDEALTRGAAIAFYTATSIAPILLIVIAIAGLVFGQDAAQNAITAQFSDLMGRQTAEVLQSAVASAAGKSSSILATIIGLATLIATASGIFGEMQAALNSIWKTKPQATTVSRLIRARAVSLGLVAALGFLLIVSLVISAGLTVFGNYLDTVLPLGKLILPALNFVVSIVLLGILFGAIYKMLPDRSLQWKDVIIGALITSVLFNIGKSLIAWYIGSSAIASSYGAAGGLIVLLLWVYYSAQIFLLGGLSSRKSMPTDMAASKIRGLLKGIPRRNALASPWRLFKRDGHFCVNPPYRATNQVCLTLFFADFRLTFS